MARRRLFRPEDAHRLKAVADPDISPDGKRVAYAVVATDVEADKPVSAIWVAPLDGSVPPRRFSDGSADRSPRWSPDGKWLAYLSSNGNPGRDDHVRLAPLDGGAPQPLGELPGPVLQFAWSPDSARLAAVCRTGVPHPEGQTAAEKNAPRAVRGLGARLDGVGWQDGRRHIFLLDVDTGDAKQVTRGDHDNVEPSFSPDGSLLAFSSDRHAERDDRQFRGDVWTMPAGGGRATRLSGGKGRASHPAFSPDGSLVAFAGQDSDSWDADPAIFVVPADGGSPPRQLAPGTDRGTLSMPGAPSPFRWAGNKELVFLLADEGRFVLHTARVGDLRSKEALGGDVQIDSFALDARRRRAAFSSAWPDRPSELYTAAVPRNGQRATVEPVNVSHLNDDLVAEVKLAQASRTTIVRPDGTSVEYFSLLPPDGPARGLPLHLDIHGGPHGMWPSGRFLAFHQSIAAGGYAVVLPNPRGSTGYGQSFTEACTGDWGGADCEDILACCDDLVEKGVADPDRMFLGGGSYGGFMTSWIVGHTNRFKAATAVAAVIDQTSMALTTEIPYFALWNMGGTPWEAPDEYAKRSPLTYLPDVETPVLVIHSEGDLRVPMGQGEELYQGLRILGKQAELLRYPGGFHIVRTPSQNVDWARRILSWNGRHDPGGSSATPSRRASRRRSQRPPAKL